VLRRERGGTIEDLKLRKEGKKVLDDGKIRAITTDLLQVEV